MKDIKDTKEIIPAFEAKTDPFGGNVSGEHAYKRAERIVSALYLVTNHVRYDEPLRMRLRSLGHEMLTEVIALRGGFRAATTDSLGAPLASVRECISLVQLLQIAGYVSSQNVSILTHALDELGQFLVGAQHSNLSDTLQLSREDFLPSERQRTESVPSTYARLPHNTPQPKQIGSSKVSHTTDAQARLPRPPGRSVQTEVHGERRKLIMDILAKSGPLGIKDISTQMVGCSEKTVQRELSVLIQESRIKKEGEKRWSSYSLIR
jgi:hypothetical protein